jgi:hypothetical protein
VKTRKNKPTKWEGLQDHAEEELGKEIGLVAILTWNPLFQEVTCYGRHIDDGRIFQALNMSTNASVRYRTRKQFRGCHAGIFVGLGNFEAKANPDWVVALVNIPEVPGGLKASPFKL